MISVNLLINFAAGCPGGGLLGFPTWYKYLPPMYVDGICSPQLNSLSAVWLIAAAIIEILLRVAALVAVAFVIYGGFQLITSQGDPNKTAQARSTIINALVGLAVAILSGVIIGFIAGRIS